MIVIQVQVTIWRILWTTANTARISVFLTNSFNLSWSVEFTLFSYNTNISDFQIFLWLFTLLILGLLSDNCFYLFIFNSWSINTPNNMTHQPLAIPHKETGLFGATKIWFWRGAVWFHNSTPFSFHWSLSRTPLSSFEQCSEMWFWAEPKARGKKKKKTSL